MDIPQTKKRKKIAAKTQRHKGFTKYFGGWDLLSSLSNNASHGSKEHFLREYVVTLCLCGYSLSSVFGNLHPALPHLFLISRATAVVWRVVRNALFISAELLFSREQNRQPESGKNKLRSDDRSHSSSPGIPQLRVFHSPVFRLHGQGRHRFSTLQVTPPRPSPWHRLRPERGGRIELW